MNFGIKQSWVMALLHQKCAHEGNNGKEVQTQEQAYLVFVTEEILMDIH
jgi:hypothetical protein